MAFEVVARNPKDFSDKLLSLKERKKLCDVSLIVNGERIFVHSNVLAASSEYFESIFINSELKQMFFVDVNKDALQSIVEFCYTGRISISEKNAKEVFLLSSQLSIPSIVEGSSKILERNLSVDNYLSTWRIAKQGNFDSLKFAAIEHARNNFKKIINSQEYLSLEYSEIMELLDSNTIFATENIIYEAVKNWVEKDRASRAEHLESLLDRIKLECLPRDFLMTESLLLCKSSTTGCYEKFIKALISQKSVDSSSCGRFKSMIAIGGSVKSMTKSMEIFNPIDQKWTETSIDCDKTSFSTVLLNDKLMMIGGKTNSAINTVECYDLKSGKIETYSPMRQARYNFAAVVHKGFVFAIGGQNPNALSSVEKLDLTTKTWTEVASITNARSRLVANVLNDEIYVTGGYNGHETFSSVEAYNISTGKWRPRASMIEKRSEPASAVVRDFLYVVGGNNLKSQLSTAERYDPNIDKWSYIQSMGSINTALSAVGFMGKLVTSGGYTNNEYQSKVEVYDENITKWKPMPSLNKSRTAFSLIEVPWNLVEHIISKKT